MTTTDKAKFKNWRKKDLYSCLYVDDKSSWITKLQHLKENEQKIATKFLCNVCIVEFCDPLKEK